MRQTLLDTNTSRSISCEVALTILFVYLLVLTIPCGLYDSRLRFRDYVAPQYAIGSILP